MAKEISDAEFELEVEKDGGVVFVDFWAPWCGPCKMMIPVFEKISVKYPQIKFIKVNTTDNMEKAGQYNVSGIPCIIVFKAGKEVDRLVGYRDEASFESEVLKYSK